MTSSVKLSDTLFPVACFLLFQLIEFYQDPFNIKKAFQSGTHIAFIEIKVYVPSCFNIIIKTT